MNTHPEQWAAIYAMHGTRGAVGGSVPCSRAPRRGIESEESTVHLLPPPFTDNPCWNETRIHNLSIMSPALYH